MRGFLVLLALLPALAAAQEEDEEAGDVIVIGEADEGDKLPPEPPLVDWIIEPLVAMPAMGDGLSSHPAPEDVGGLSVLPLAPDEDLGSLQLSLVVGAHETVVLVSGAMTDRYAVDGVRLQLPPPFLVLGLRDGVHEISLLRNGQIHHQKVRCAEGHLSLFDTESVMAAMPSPERAESIRQRQLLVELLERLEGGGDLVAKIRLCMAFLGEHPDGEAADQAQTILGNLRQRLDDDSAVELGDDIPTEELRERQRLETLAQAPRPPGTRPRQIVGITLTVGAVGLAVAALAMEHTAAGAADQYHRLRLEGDDTGAAPYLHQARSNETGAQVSVAVSVAAAVAAAAVLIADGALRTHWKRIRRDHEGDSNEDGMDLALVPSPGGLALVGRW